MYVIQVTPLMKGTKLESLSYFSSVEYSVGTFLHIPVRGKQQPALVTASKPVSSTKTALKAATFSLRKLPVQKNTITLPDTLLQTAQALTDIYPVSVGAILFALLPTDIRNGARQYPNVTPTPHDEETTPHILTARFDERLLYYQSHIRSTFAHRGSVLLVVPTSADIPFVAEKVSVGIEERVVTLSSTHTKRQRLQAFEAIEDSGIAKLIITTPAYAYIERVDLLSIIIEQSASAHYKIRQRPYLDHRDALIRYAKTGGRSIVLGDTVPRTEEEVLRREDRYYTADEPVKRIAFPAPLTIVKQKDKPQPDMPFQLFSQQLLRAAEHALEARGRVFLYSARRGLAPIVACIDCGHIFRCPDSGTPYSLVRTRKNGEEERWFVCSTSGKKEPAADVCTECGSWRLRERGIGIQHVYDEWREKMPNTDVTLMDHLSASTPQKAARLADDFFKKKTGVLIGTQVALPYLNHGVDVSAIVSLDAARSIPTWRADESLFRLFLRLREVTEKEVIVQTRNKLETDPLLTYASRGALERFYDDEISLRQMLGYPPFANFLLLSWVGNKESVAKTSEDIKGRLAPLGAQTNFYHNPNSTTTKTLAHALIRISAVDTELYQKAIDVIRTLPPYVKVEINPERIV